MDIIDHVKKVIRASGRKSYTMVMGKLNVAKMANFMEVDCYVLVACPENSLIDSKVTSLTLSLFVSIILGALFYGCSFFALFFLCFCSLSACSSFCGPRSYLLTVTFDFACVCVYVCVQEFYRPIVTPFELELAVVRYMKMISFLLCIAPFSAHIILYVWTKTCIDPRSGQATILLISPSFYRMCVRMASRIKMRQV